MKTEILFLLTIVCIGIGFVLGRTIPSTNISKPNYDDAMMHNHMDHGLIEVGEEESIPSIEMSLFKQTEKGIDLNISTTNFTFSPTDIDKEHVHGFGHGHMYINEQKYTRLYSDWLHIPQKHLFNGANTICASLNSNNHAHYAVDGKIIKSCVTVMNSI